MSDGPTDAEILNEKFREMGVLGTSESTPPNAASPPQSAPAESPPPFNPKPHVESLNVWWLNGKDRYFQTRGDDLRTLEWGEKDVKRELRLRGIFSRSSDGKAYSQADVVMKHIQTERCVDYAGPISGKRVGLHESHGRRMLATSSYRLIEPNPGEWPTLRTVLNGLFVTDDVDQTPWVYAWLKVAIEALRKGRPRPGHGLIMAGPSDCGKSFLQQHVFTPLLGGRPPADPTKYLLGQTTFNAEMAATEHLAIQELPSYGDNESRVLLGEELKRLIATENHPLHAKYCDALTIYPWWRLSISINDSVDKLRGLPPLSADFSDKVLLLLCKSCPENFPGPDVVERDKFLQDITSELPAFVHFLLTWPIPPELTKSKHAARFGHDHFHHPRLVASLFDQERESSLLYILDNCPELYVGGKFDGAWGWHPAEKLREQLCNEVEYQRFSSQARKLFERSGACASYLSKLAEKWPKRFARKHNNDGNVWMIVGPEK